MRRSHIWDQHRFVIAAAAAAAFLVASSCSSGHEGATPRITSTNDNAVPNPIDGAYHSGSAPYPVHSLRFVRGTWAEDPGSVLRGTFSVSGDRLVLSGNDCPNGSYTWTRRQGVLTLTSVDDLCSSRQSAISGEWTASVFVD